MKPITFCIASANNEREYTRLVLQSLKDHTNLELHEVLVFVDSDNQNTYEMLQTMREQIPTLRVCKNDTGFPIGSQRNVSVMFNAASNDIVCYLQSDMVVGRDFDKHISNNIDENTVLSCARIEPPLHPASPEKIVKDFGITPETFDYEAFNNFVATLQAENKPNMVGHFAPFAIYKTAWFDKLGGFDTQFRCSREDSDTILRMSLCGLKMIQSWNACVYHFTCVSSRGTDWYKQDEQAKYKNELQQHADLQELKRFIRKWGFFGHDPKPVYDVSIVIELDQYANLDLLKAVEPYCSRMYLSDKSVVDQLASELEFEAHYYSNLRLKYTSDHWKDRMYLFNPTDFKDRIRLSSNEIQGDTIVSMKYSDLVKSWNQETHQMFENIHQLVDQHDEGEYDAGFAKIHISRKNDKTASMLRANNIDLLLSDQKFEFN